MLEAAKGLLIFLSMIPQLRKLVADAIEAYKEAEAKRRLGYDEVEIDKALRERNAKALHDLFANKRK